SIADGGYIPSFVYGSFPRKTFTCGLMAFTALMAPTTLDAYCAVVRSGVGYPVRSFVPICNSTMSAGQAAYQELMPARMSAELRPPTPSCFLERLMPVPSVCVPTDQSSGCAANSVARQPPTLSG